MEKMEKINIPTRFFQKPTSEEVFAQWEREERELEEFKNRKSYKLVLPEGYVNNNKVITDDIIKELKNEKGDRAFLFAGGVGSGKTYLSHIISDCMIPDRFRSSEQFKYDNAYELWEFVKHCYSTNKSVENEVNFSRFYVLDDLGAEDNTDASRSFFHNHLLRMYSRWKGGGFKLLIVNMNIGFEQIKERYTARVESRFYEMFKLYRFADKDFRRDKMRLISNLKKNSNNP